MAAHPSVTTAIGNVLARAAASLEIGEVRSTKTGQLLEARNLIERLPYDRFIRFRTLLREEHKAGTARLRCAICGAGVYLVANPQKRFFFRHVIEDGSCPARTRTGLTEADIRAMKYRGAQESEPHRRLKSLIVRSLRCDPKFSNVQVEQTWRASDGKAGLRRPDVRAAFGDLFVAFEAQLSTTFLDVVIERKAFYRAEGALLVWVLPSFDPVSKRLTVDDILYNNNANVLIVDEETTAASEQAQTCMVRCWYGGVQLVDRNIEHTWASRIVPWRELQWDTERQQTYLVDCEAEDLRMSFLQFILQENGTEESQVRWRQLRNRFAQKGMIIGGDYGPEGALRDIVRSVLSAQAGKPIGYGFRNLIEVAHRLFEQRKEAVLPFGFALRAAGYEELLKTQDQSGKWRKKVDEMKAAIAAGSEAYRLNEPLRAIAKFLFPNIANRL